MNENIVICQGITIEPFPVASEGQEVFLGYVVGLGVAVLEWGDAAGMVPYVDVSYNSSFRRFRLPDDEGLRRDLLGYLAGNMSPAVPGDIYGKVHVRKLATGYEVFLP